MTFADSVTYTEYIVWQCKICGTKDGVKYELGSEAEHWAHEHWKAKHSPTMGS